MLPGKLFLGLHSRFDATSVARLHLRYSTTLGTRADPAVEQQLHPRRFAVGAVIRTRRRFVSFAGFTHPYLGSSRKVTAGNTCSAP